MKGIPMEQTVRQEFCGVVLAAGLSTRMGAFKPLVPLCGKPLIQNSIDHMLSGGATTVVVVVGFHATEMEALLSSAYGPEVQVVYNPQFATRDMMYSIQVGCAHLPPCDAFFLLPGDMPVIQPATFRLLIDAWRRRPGGVIFPTLEGYRKHPPLIASALVPAIRSFQGNGGLRQFWAETDAELRNVAVDDQGVWVDVDTPEDYRGCRNRYEKERMMHQEGCNGKDQSIGGEERPCAESVWPQHLCG